nr:inactive beta-amylase 9 [Quercus suber]
MEVSMIGSSQVKTELAYRELGFCNLKGGKAVISSKNRVCFGRSTGWRKSGIRFTLRATAAIQSEPLRSDSVSGRSRISKSVKTELAYRELGFCNLKGGKAVISSKNRVCFGRSTGWRKSGIRFTLRATAAIQSEPLRSDSVSGRSRISKSRDNVRLFVGLPLDSISDCNAVNHARAIAAGLKALKLLGVEGVELPVWWGTVEKEAMGKYEWSGYLALAEMVQNAGLKLHVSLCFHASKQHKLSLPEWVSRIGESEPGIFFTDRAGQQYKECLSLAVDDLPVLDGKTPVQVYHEFCESFKSSFSSFMGSTITGISMGLGPDGELRYPSHQRLVKRTMVDHGSLHMLTSSFPGTQTSLYLMENVSSLLHLQLSVRLLLRH